MEALVPIIDDGGTVLLDGAVVVGVAGVAAVSVLLQLFSLASSPGVDYLQTDSASDSQFSGSNTDGSSEVARFLPLVVALLCLATHILHYNRRAVVLNSPSGVAVGVPARTGGSRLPFQRRRLQTGDRSSTVGGGRELDGGGRK